ncbi:AraC family transcriptional regulator [Paenibacillus sp. NPDC056579]|uniref:helix-turn-helix transcriptional regulator n=1 Tax=unclassified Paenibacillus TaxID=185978 RepID=UPI001EF8E2D2|nr:helix-turn-helix domain-containing protein [Paenibacillus sp. H1-7]ULL18294.1 AraC family transcriptional regulator [Paenibacillus sp. H1-7]
MTIPSFRKMFLLSALDQQLPFYVESIGIMSHQENIYRNEGYPYFHWLQTIDGEGEFTFGNERFLLPTNQGILLIPHIPHYYEARTPVWTTMYITFGGDQIQSILTSLGLHLSSLYKWEEQSPLATILERILDKIKIDSDFSELDCSIELYQFLICLKKYGQTNNQTSLSRLYSRLKPLLNWLDEVCRDENITLDTMAQRVHMSPQHLNKLFRSTFGISPYSYLIRLRIQKSKEALVAQRQTSIKEIAKDVGFLDVSHFTATFRKTVGMTPDQFRKLHTS